MTELRAMSAFSFLQGASLPEDLARQAARLGYESLALADRNGVYGIPRFCKAAKDAGVRPLVGARIDLDEGIGGPGLKGPTNLLLLCRSATGWKNLCEMLSRAHREHPKGQASVSLDDLATYREGLVALAGGMDGPVLTTARARGKKAGAGIAGQLVGIFGPHNLFFDLQRQGIPTQEQGNRLLADLGTDLGIPLVASQDVRYACPENGPIHDVLNALRLGCRLDAARESLPVNHQAFLHAPNIVRARFPDHPGLIERSQELAASLCFDLSEIDYSFPVYPTPPGQNMDDLLEHLVLEGIRRRYRNPTPRVLAQVEHELALIRKLRLAGYFLLVHDLVRFCEDNDILAQGRGSAANSVVCYALRITAIDPIAYDLLFERFLSEERGEWPDIDLDLPSGNDRETVLQYVYRRYGAQSVGMTAAVNTFCNRGAIREAGKVLGIAPLALDRMARAYGHYEFKDSDRDATVLAREAGLDPADRGVRLFLQVMAGIRGLPRHLSQHNGGMVIAGGRLDRVVPLEPAAMAGRTVIQWDKDDIADLRIIKVDLLGLGMMAALKETLRLVREGGGPDIDLGQLPPDDPAVYRLLQTADTVGVFQVESRAQMATLPRMRPTRFYDIVVSVAIIRPGPILGKMVHPYLARRAGREPVRYAAPCLEPILARTLGVPLFQEQIMRVAMAAGGFTGGQAEELRRAMGSRRSQEQMQKMILQLREGMTVRSLAQDAQADIVRSIESFAMYGFPESHAASFALIAYASAWLKVHHPSAFFAALLNCWPMGFYAPATLIEDAKRHGVAFLPIDVSSSERDCTCSNGPVRLGLRFVRGLAQSTIEAIVRERRLRPWVDIHDLAFRTGASRNEMATLAEVGACASFGGRRRDALWQCLSVNRNAPLLQGAGDERTAPFLPPMSQADQVMADLRTSGVTTGPHPVSFLRSQLASLDVTTAINLASLRNGVRTRIAGLLIIRQRPATAGGFCFLTLEDETGLANVVLPPDVFQTYRTQLSVASMVLVEGVLSSRDGVVNVRATSVIPVSAVAPPNMPNAPDSQSFT